MQSYEGIYENGVVRFLGPISIAEHAKVPVIAQPAVQDQPPIGCNSAELYEVLSHRYDNGEHDLARHHDHQPQGRSVFVGWHALVRVSMWSYGNSWPSRQTPEATAPDMLNN